MKLHPGPGLCALVLAFALTGCGGDGEQAKTEQKTDQPAQSAAESPAPGAETAPAAGSMTEGATMVLAGTTGCGHCTFGKTKDCAAAMKTAAGEIYVIDGVAQDSELWKAREDSKTIQLTGAVSRSDVDGLMHVQMESYQLN